MSYEIFCGLDVGKATHHATGLDGDGNRLVDREIANDETALRRVFTELTEQGTVLVVVDQPSSIGALPIAVARAMGIEDESLADLSVLVGHDDDLAEQATAVSNRIRGLLLQIHPAFERVLGENAAHKAVLAVLVKFGGPTGIKAAGKAKVGRVLKAGAPRMGERLTNQIFDALAEQTVVVPGTAAAEKVLPRLAEQLLGLQQQRKQVATEVEEALDAHPLSRVLTSMPGVGVRTAARILITVGDASSFPTAGHLAAYAGLAPVTRRSGSSIRGEFPSRSGNKDLKNALFLSAFAALRDPASRAYYDRKRAEGKKHNAAIICLARRRTDVLYAMLRNNQAYIPQTPQAA